MDTIPFSQVTLVVFDFSVDLHKKIECMMFVNEKPKSGLSFCFKNNPAD